MDSNPKLGFAFRTAVERGKKWELTAEDIIAKLGKSPKKSSVRKVPTPSGPFPFQLYFEDLAEIDEICLEALKTQSLLPSRPAPIRIERFVEKEFKTALRYEDLGPDNLGCTIFNSSGAVEAILVSRSLEEQNTTPARRRVRSTVAHEAGHGLLHGSLFVEDNFPNLGDNQRRILCRSE